MTRDSEGSGTKETCDHRAGDTPAASVQGIINVEGCLEWSLVMDKMRHATEHSFDRARLKLPVGSVPHLFTFDTVLLSGDSEGNE